MGCGKSKQAPAAAAAPAPAAAPEGDFKINLEKTEGITSLGISAAFPEKKHVLVQAVKEEGMIPTWNKALENTPEQQVTAGFLILAVNGVYGDTDLMMKEVADKQTLSLTVKRAEPTKEEAAAPAEEPVAEPAAEPAEGALPAAEAPAAAVPAAEGAAAEAPATTEAPAAEMLAATAPAAEGTPAAEAAAEALAAEAPVAPPADEGLVNVEPENTEVNTSPQEERLCKMAIC